MLLLNLLRHLSVELYRTILFLLAGRTIFLDRLLSCLKFLQSNYSPSSPPRNWFARRYRRTRYRRARIRSADQVLLLRFLDVLGRHVGEQGAQPRRTRAATVPGFVRIRWIPILWQIFFLLDEEGFGIHSQRFGLLLHNPHQRLELFDGSLFGRRLGRRSGFDQRLQLVKTTTFDYFRNITHV